MAKKSDLLVGLDVGTSKVVTVVGAVNDHGVSVVGLGTSSSEEGLRKGVVVNIDATVHAIEQAVKEAELSSGCEINSVFVNVAGNHIRGFNSHGVVHVRDEEVTQADVDRVLDAARAVALPADREILHVLPQDFVLDGQDGIKSPVGMSGVRLESRVHIITTSSPSASNVLKCCQRTGLTVQDLVLEPLAAAEAVLTPEEKELGVALVDLGAGTTDLLIFHQGALRQTHVFAVGGNHITSDLAAGLQTPFREAELLKLQNGSALARLVERDEPIEVASVGGRAPRIVGRRLLAQIIEARAEETLGMVQKQILKCGYEDALGSGIVLTGGTALLANIVPLAEQVFRRPVRIGVPLGGRDPDDDSGGNGNGNGNGSNTHAKGAPPEIYSPSYAAAIGLLRYGARPQDWAGMHPESPKRFGWMRDRLRGLMEALFE